jgi:ABC-type Na+ efflux pump permease subunit
MAEMADGLFHAISAVQYGAVIIFVPLFLCGSVAVEREEKTLDALLLTLLKDREIVWGKLASRIPGLVLLQVASVPFLSVLPLFGGVPPGAVGLIFAATLLTLLFPPQFPRISRSQADLIGQPSSAPISAWASGCSLCRHWFSPEAFRVRPNC